MALTEQQLRQWFLTNFPTRDWHHLCQAFVFRAAEATGGADTVYGSATDAFTASSIVSTDALAAPIGAVHYWRFFATIKGVHKNFGHVAVALGDGRAAMASSLASGWGVNAGVVDVKGWTTKTGLPYLGWARTNGRNRINLVGVLAPTQRRVLSAAAVSRRIGAPSTSAPKGEPLAPGSIGNFNGWIRGERVQGSDVWFRGVSGDFFWSGGFDGGADKTGLPALDPAPAGVSTAPASASSPGQRTVLATAPVRRRIGAPSTTAPKGEPLPAGAVGSFVGWVEGENVSGNSTWFVGVSGDFFWSGGFVGGADRTGLPQLPAPTPPAPPVMDVAAVPVIPVGAVPRTPVYPRAVRGWSVPLGQKDRDEGVVIDRFIVHHTASTGSDEEFFKADNERGSCPTWYVLADGSVIETIDPARRPSSTGSANSRSVAVETQNTTGEPAWGISDASHESIAEIIAWFHAMHHGRTLAGHPVDLPIDRSHVIGHNEAGVAPTACPGPSMDLERLVVRASELAEAGS